MQYVHPVRPPRAPDESLAGSWRRTNHPLTVLTPLAQTSLQKSYASGLRQASAVARYSRGGVDVMAAKSDMTVINITRSLVTAHALTSMFSATRLHKNHAGSGLPNDSQP